MRLQDDSYIHKVPYAFMVRGALDPAATRKIMDLILIIPVNLEKLHFGCQEGNESTTKSRCITYGILSKSSASSSLLKI